MTPEIDAAVELAAETLKAGINFLGERGPIYQPIVDALIASDSPASASNSTHGGFEKGLLVHTVRVFQVATQLASGGEKYLRTFIGRKHPIVQDEEKYESLIGSINPGSIFVASLLHDLNKLRTVCGNPYYVPNMLKSGVRSDKKPFEINKDVPSPFVYLAKLARGENVSSWTDVFACDTGVLVRDGLISLAVAAQIQPELMNYITAYETDAVIFHDGAYAGRKDLAGRESPLQILIHAADMIASRVLC